MVSRPNVYPGGKNAAGVYHRIINLMPPHDLFVEPFYGSGAITRRKRPARVSVGFDLDPAALELAMAADDAGNGDGRPTPEAAIAAAIASSDDGDPRSFLFNGDGLAFLESHAWQGDGRELVYADPPYVHSTRTKRRIYLFEWDDATHRRFLRCCRKLHAVGVLVMISGYWSPMYAAELTAAAGWHWISYAAQTRGGVKTEHLWFNFPPPLALHDYQYLGGDIRERERIKRKIGRWVARLRRMPTLERQAMLAAVGRIAGNGDDTRLN